MRVPGVTSRGSLMDYQQAVAYLDAHIGLGGEPGLQRIRGLLDDMGDPHLGYPVIHVAGTTPTISNLQLSPSFFRPGAGNMQISFGVGTFASTFTGNVSIERMDLLGGVVKTLSIPSQAPGAVSLQWNGTVDSGAMLAAGRYLVTVNVTDALGSIWQDQALITIAY